MHIPTIKLTNEELNQAVQEWLAKRGVTIPVELVQKSYSGPGAWSVELTDPAPAEPVPTNP